MVKDIQKVTAQEVRLMAFLISSISGIRDGLILFIATLCSLCLMTNFCRTAKLNL